MIPRPNKRNFFSALILLLILLFIADVALGSVWIPFKEIFLALQGKCENETWDYIIKEIRIPRAVVAVLAGAGLSLTGLLMQTLFRNPLAGPFVLGISSGASLGVALLIMASGILGGSIALAANMVSTTSMIIAAVLGASIIFLMILGLSFKVKKSVSLLIIGIMLGSMTGAIVSILQYFSSPEQIQNFLLWTFGSLGSVKWMHLQILIPMVIAGTIGSFLLHKSLDALLLGENYAFGLGVSIRKLRIWVIIIASLIAGALTAFIGPIVFIGVAVPHLARGVFHTSLHKVLIPATLITGACLMLVCDIISQLPGSYKVLPINSITALVGAPVIIWVILGNRRKLRF